MPRWSMGELARCDIRVIIFLFVSRHTALLWNRACTSYDVLNHRFVWAFRQQATSRMLTGNGE